MKLFAIFKDGQRKEIDNESAGITEKTSQPEALYRAKKELTFLEEKNLARWEFEDDFI